MPTTTATASEARAKFSQIASRVSETGTPVTVFKNSRPWVQIVPSDYKQELEGVQNSRDAKNLQSTKGQSAREVQDTEYIELIVSALRESKQQFKVGKSYTGTDTLIDKLAQERPEIWK